MNFGSTQIHQYAGLEASFDSKSHLLYFAPLEELQKAARTDTANVVVVAFIGRSSRAKSLLSNLMIDQSIFLVRLLGIYTQPSLRISEN